MATAGSRKRHESSVLFKQFKEETEVGVGVIESGVFSAALFFHKKRNGGRKTKNK